MAHHDIWRCRGRVLLSLSPTPGARTIKVGPPKWGSGAETSRDLTMNNGVSYVVHHITQMSLLLLSGIELQAKQIKKFINLEFDVTALYFCAFYSAVPAGDLDNRD